MHHLATLSPLEWLWIGLVLFVVGVVAWQVWNHIRNALRRSKRTSHQRKKWNVTRGRIEEYIARHNRPLISYRYHVNGVEYVGKSFATADSSPHGFIPERTYLLPDGSLRFPPGAQVDVYYAPRKPKESALMVSTQTANWANSNWLQAGLPIVVVLGILLSIAASTMPAATFERSLRVILIVAFAAAGAATFYFGILGQGRRLFKLRKAVVTQGKLLEAHAEYAPYYQPGSRPTVPYIPAVYFEYEVDGQLYRSCQFNALPPASGPQWWAQAKVEHLQSQSSLTVYYDPLHPWDAYLHPGPWSRLIVFLIVTAAAWSISVIFVCMSL